MSTEAACATGSAANQELGWSPKSEILHPGDLRCRHCASLHVFPPRLQAPLSLCHSGHGVQVLKGCCVLAHRAPERGHGHRERHPLPARTSPSSHSHGSVPWTEQALRPAMLTSLPIPGCLHISHLLSSACLLSLPMLLPAATGVGVQRELSERAMGSFGKGKGWRSCGQGKYSRSTDCWAHSQLFHLLTSSVLA